MSSDVANVFVGSQANDGTGDAIRTAFQTVNSNFYNIDNRISTGNIAVIFSTVGVTAQTFTSNSYAHTQTLEVYQTANVAGNVQIENLSVNSAFTASTITSTGNTTVQGGFVVDGSAHLNQNLVVVGNLTVLGNALTVNSSDLNIQDSIIQLHNPADSSPLTSDDGKDIGFQFHYYKTTDKHAALVWANDSQALEFYADGIESLANTFTGTYGNVKIGSLFVNNTTPAISATTGSIVTQGGASAEGNVWVGENLNVVGNSFLQTANVKQLSVSERVVGSLYLTGTDTIYVNGSPVSTSAGSFTGGTVPTYTLFSTVVEARGNIFANSQVSSTSINTGALVVNGGVGISGNVHVGGAFVVASIQNTPIGNSTPAFGAFTTLYANSTTESTTVSSGALIVKGGVGIAGNLNVGGSINNTSIGIYGAAVGNFTTIGATTSGSGVFTSLKASSNLVAFSGTASTNVTTGAAVVVGGLGVSGTINAGAITVASGGLLTADASLGNVTISNAQISSGNIVSTYGVVTNFSTGNAQIAGGDASLSTLVTTNFSSGNVKISGGYITGQSNIAISGSAQSTSTTTGALTIVGGIGVGGNINIGGSGGNAIVHTGNIIPSANGAYNIGSSTNWYGTFYGVSSQAKYADLAENYISDGTCGAGQVVIFGGDAEITIATEFADTRVAGVISTNPAYLMNSDCYQGQPVALRGRVPVIVIGKVAKGDLLVSSDTPGCAVSVGKDKSHGASVFAKSLNDKGDDGIGQIEAVII